MEYLTIKNWDKWQTYRKDRGQPPWIKLHRELMRNIEWVSLSDAQRGQLVAIWLLAADRDGVIPASPEIIKKLCHMDSLPDLKLFINYGFIEDGDIMTPECRQHDVTDTEGEAEAEADTEEITTLSGKEPDISPPKPQYKPTAVSVLDFLNEKTGRNYQPVKANIDMIVARLKEGATEDECRQVIAKKSREWLNDDDMNQYLRPATLFNRTKFAQYQGELVRVTQ